EVLTYRRDREGLGGRGSRRAPGDAGSAGASPSRGRHSGGGSKLRGTGILPVGIAVGTGILPLRPTGWKPVSPTPRGARRGGRGAAGGVRGPSSLARLRGERVAIGGVRGRSLTGAASAG